MPGSSSAYSFFYYQSAVSMFKISDADVLSNDIATQYHKTDGFFHLPFVSICFPRVFVHVFPRGFPTFSPCFIPQTHFSVKEVSLACHYRVASPKSSVGFPEALVYHGVPP